MGNVQGLRSNSGSTIHAMIEGDELYRGSTEKTLCCPTGFNARTGTYSNSISVFYAVRGEVTCKRCLKALAAKTAA